MSHSDVEEGIPDNYRHLHRVSLDEIRKVLKLIARHKQCAIGYRQTRNQKLFLLQIAIDSEPQKSFSDVYFFDLSQYQMLNEGESRAGKPCITTLADAGLRDILTSVDIIKVMYQSRRCINEQCGIELVNAVDIQQAVNIIEDRPPHTVLPLKDILQTYAAIASDCFVEDPGLSHHYPSTDQQVVDAASSVAYILPAYYKMQEKVRDNDLVTIIQRSNTQQQEPKYWSDKRPKHASDICLASAPSPSSAIQDDSVEEEEVEDDRFYNFRHRLAASLDECRRKLKLIATHKECAIGYRQTNERVSLLQIAFHSGKPQEFAADVLLIDLSLYQMLHEPESPTSKPSISLLADAGLRDLLSSADITKVMYESRRFITTLYEQCGIQLVKAFDIQQAVNVIENRPRETTVHLFDILRTYAADRSHYYVEDPALSIHYPLTDDQIVDAASSVAYLLPIYFTMRKLVRNDDLLRVSARSNIQIQQQQKVGYKRSERAAVAIENQTVFGTEFEFKNEFKYDLSTTPSPFTKTPLQIQTQHPPALLAAQPPPVLPAPPVRYRQTRTADRGAGTSFATISSPSIRIVRN